MEFDPHTRLAGECLQPLGHLSLRSGSQFRACGPTDAPTSSSYGTSTPSATPPCSSLAPPFSSRRSHAARITTTFDVKKPHKVTKTPFLVTIHNDKGYVTYIGK
jgi:hypothetical protein